MKLITTYLLAFFSLIICNAQDDSKRTKLMVPEIDNKFEKFDHMKFKNQNIDGLLQISEDKLFIEHEVQPDGYISRYYTGYFILIKKYFENFGIREKGILINQGDQISVWYKFDIKGNLIEEINTDEGYTFGWKKVITYCKKKEIELTKGYEKGGYQTEILKQEENGKKVWVISYLVSPVLVCRETLDGITGELLNSEEFEFINH